jgi:hypothetical protein
MIGGKSRSGHAESHAMTDVVYRQTASRMGFVSQWINRFTTSRYMAQNDGRNRAAGRDFPLVNALSAAPVDGLVLSHCYTRSVQISAYLQSGLISCSCPRGGSASIYSGHVRNHPIVLVESKDQAFVVNRERSSPLKSKVIRRIPTRESGSIRVPVGFPQQIR